MVALGTAIGAVVASMHTRLDKATGEVKLVRMASPNSRPYGIELDSKGRAWFNQFNTNKIGMLDPVTMKVTDYPLPDPAARGRRIAVTADDMVWYVDYARGYLGRLNPETAKVDEWAMPGGARSRPYAMTVDDRGRLWAVETGVSPNQFVGFDPKAELLEPLGDLSAFWSDPQGAAFFGFGGVRADGAAVRIDPRLPEAWAGLTFPIRWRGTRIVVDVRGAEDLQILLERRTVEADRLAVVRALVAGHLGTRTVLEPRHELACGEPQRLRRFDERVTGAARARRRAASRLRRPGS